MLVDRLYSMKMARKNEPIKCIDKNEWKQKILGETDYSKLIMNKNKYLIKDYGSNRVLNLNTKLQAQKVDSFDGCNDRLSAEKNSMEKVKSKQELLGSKTHNTASINKLHIYLNKIEENHNKLI